jgi:prepilin-type N-terminal cleavage/methylation domain-containing protein
MNHLKGVSLIEVLISLFIFSLLLLGAAGMQFSALHQTESAYYFNIALEQLHSMTEHLHVTKGEQIDTLQQSWNEQIQHQLPNGAGLIEGNFPHFSLTVHWGESSAHPCDRTTIGLSGCVKQAVNIKGVSSLN